MKHTPIVALDHISVPVRDLEVARKFYATALGALGMRINMEVSNAFGMGSKKEKIFWLVKDKKATGDGHYALRVNNREEVHAFHAAALDAGGKDNGKPGHAPPTGATTTPRSCAIAKATTSRSSATRAARREQLRHVRPRLRRLEHAPNHPSRPHHPPSKPADHSTGDQ